MSLLGIEIRASGSRALVISAEGLPIAQARREHRIIAGPDGTQECDSREIWAVVRSLIRDVAAQTRQDPIRALSISSSHEGLTPISAEGQILGNCILSTDPRGKEYASQVERTHGAGRFFEITGQILNERQPWTKLCWLRDKKPEIYISSRFLPWGSLIAYLLGGASACDHSLANLIAPFELVNKRWSRELLEACGLFESKLPDIMPAGKSIGTVSGVLARELELPPNVRIGLGGHAWCCRALGAGVTQSGMISYYLGSAIHGTLAYQAIPLASLLLARGLSMALHVVERLLVSTLSSPLGGSVLRWFSDNLAPLEKREAQRRGRNVYDDLLAEMPDEPTKLIAIPDMALTEPSTRDGYSALIGLKMTTTRGEIIKALLEGLTYDLADKQDAWRQVGIYLRMYRATGGWARSDGWLQITADILGVPVERPQILNAGPLGAALLAGVSNGTFASIDEAVARVVRVQRRFEPDPKRHAAYRSRIEEFRRLRAWLQAHSPVS